MSVMSYKPPLFIEWLWDQLERTDEVGKIARLTWTDRNAGCAVTFKNWTGWVEHFTLRHKAKADELIRLVHIAYQAYYLEHLALIPEQSQR